MRIFDKANTELTTIDESKGLLVPDRIFITHHEAIEAVTEEGHWVTIKEYPNGGKDVEWVVDVPAVEAVDAWDEYEDIYRYVEFTQEELAWREEAAKSVWDLMAEALREGVNSI